MKKQFIAVLLCGVMFCGCNSLSNANTSNGIQLDTAPSIVDSEQSDPVEHSNEGSLDTAQDVANSTDSTLKSESDSSIDKEDSDESVNTSTSEQISEPISSIKESSEYSSQNTVNSIDAVDTVSESSPVLSTSSVFSEPIALISDDKENNEEYLITEEQMSEPAESSVERSAEPIQNPANSIDTVQESEPALPTLDEPNQITYVLNTKSYKVHQSNCREVEKISPENYSETTDLQGVINSGYTPCGYCKPFEQTGDVTENNIEESAEPIQNPANSIDTVQEPEPALPTLDEPNQITYVLNTKRHKVHKTDCSDVEKIAKENYAETTDLQAAINEGYTACGHCKPF